MNENLILTIAFGYLVGRVLVVVVTVLAKAVFNTWLSRNVKARVFIRRRLIEDEVLKHQVVPWRRPRP